MNRLILLVILLAPGWGLAQESKEKPQPSLFELARRERARRASSGSTTPVITNATIQGMKGLVSTSESPTPAETAKEEAEGEGNESEESEDSKISEEELASKFDEARLNLKNAVNRSMVVQLKMNELRNSYFRESDGSRKSRIQKELQDLQADMQISRQEVETARAAIQALEGEARKAGVAPEDIRKMVGDLPQEESITSSPGGDSGPGS